jgi:hypothetical protein
MDLCTDSARSEKCYFSIALCTEWAINISFIVACVYVECEPAIKCVTVACVCVRCKPAV